MAVPEERAVLGEVFSDLVHALTKQKGKTGSEWVDWLQANDLIGVTREAVGAWHAKATAQQAKMERAQRAEERKPVSEQPGGIVLIRPSIVAELSKRVRGIKKALSEVEDQAHTVYSGFPDDIWQAVEDGARPLIAQAKDVERDIHKVYSVALQEMADRRQDAGADSAMAASVEKLERAGEHEEPDWKEWLRYHSTRTALEFWFSGAEKSLSHLKDIFKVVDVLHIWPEDKTVSVDGMRLVISESKDQAKIQDVINNIRMEAARIRKDGLGIALKDLVVKINLRKDYNVTHGYGAGKYSPACASYSKKYNDIYFHKDIDDCTIGFTFTHEVGHRFYYAVMSDQSKREWDAVINDSFISLGNVARSPDLRSLIVRFAATVQASADLASLSHEAIRSYAWDFGLAETRDKPMDQSIALASALSHMAPWIRSDPKYLSPEWAEKWLNKRQVLPERIGEFAYESEYATTNPSEAFAEAFRRYVQDGPRALGERTRAFFRRIVQEGGGVRLRQNKGAPCRR
jgi:hypothetical protein